MRKHLYSKLSDSFKIVWIVSALLLATMSVSFTSSAKTLAFPGAVGFGKYTQGGRGGDVYHVTNLNDSGSGSLRDGIESAKGPRTIVFDVAGTIILKSRLTLENKSYMTIAGQTAPGKGITLRDHNFAVYNNRHIVIRYLRVRLGDENKKKGDSPDVMTVDNNDHIILDHLSLSWGIDGNSDYRGDSNMTLQWLIYSEALNNSLHHKGNHAMCTSLRDVLGNTTVYHNIYSTSRNRHPTIASGVKKGGPDWICDFRNCIDYNWHGPANLGGVQLNVVGNYFRPGPCTDTSAYPIQMKDHDTSKAHGFADGNYFYSFPQKFNKDNFSAINYKGMGGYMPTTRERWELKKAIDCGEFAVPTQSAKNAYKTCLKYSGDSLVRDTVDERVIKNIIDQKGDIIDSQNDVGGWDTYPMVRRAKNWDTDGDGMPDSWEKANGLNPKKAGDRNGDQDGDGYTNLEEYLNSLCPDPIVK